AGTLRASELARAFAAAATPVAAAAATATGQGSRALLSAFSADPERAFVPRPGRGGLATLTTGTAAGERARRSAGTVLVLATASTKSSRAFLARATRVAAAAAAAFVEGSSTTAATGDEQARLERFHGAFGERANVGGPSTHATALETELPTAVEAARGHLHIQGLAGSYR